MSKTTERLMDLLNYLEDLRSEQPETTKMTQFAFVLEQCIEIVGKNVISSREMDDIKTRDRRL